MKRLLILAAIFSLIMTGCFSESVTVDYGEPAAQFIETGVDQKATKFINKKITIKGTVTKIDANENGDSWIHIGQTTHCNLGRLTAMAQGCKIGDIVFVDGILKTCEPGNVILNPAICRDPTAPFSPQ